MIFVDDFHKAYDRQLAVQGLSFEVLPGQILGLVGPNGAGKTTTLRAIAGIISASRGQIHVGEYEVGEHPMEAKRRVGYIPDDPQLFWDLTVAQHLAFTASAYRVPEPDAKIDALLEAFELRGKRDVVVRDLSRGMRQKLGISCAYLTDPDVLLFDEPLTGLDPLGIRKLKQSIRLRAATGRAIIVSSHLLAMVEDICTHVLVLQQGERQFFGTLDELKHRFADPNSSLTLEEIFFRATGMEGDWAEEPGADEMPEVSLR